MVATTSSVLGSIPARSHRNFRRPHGASSDRHAEGHLTHLDDRIGLLREPRRNARRFHRRPWGPIPIRSRPLDRSVWHRPGSRSPVHPVHRCRSKEVAAAPTAARGRSEPEQGCTQASAAAEPSQRSGSSRGSWSHAKRGISRSAEGLSVGKGPVRRPLTDPERPRSREISERYCASE